MKSAILTIGTEILFGQVVNTNAAFLSQKLNDMGIDVMFHYTVGDNPERLKEALNNLFSQCDLIVTTGGLGPTQDDLTKEVIAEVMERKMIVDQNALEKIEDFFKKSGRIMTENNIKQAYIPEGSVVIPNDLGSAPGFFIEKENKKIIALPGPPWEMEHMFTKYGIMLLEDMNDWVIDWRFIKTIGIGESALETELIDIIDSQSDPTIATYVKEGEAYLRITSKRKTRQECKDALDKMENIIRNKVGKYIYACDDVSIQEVISGYLEKNDMTISSAESCTGGLFADSYVSIPGSSKYFSMGLVTYTEEAKMKILGVKKETLEKYTAVSRETAEEMVEGLYKVAGSDICVSVTGLCGPESGSDEKPVGLVYIAVKYKNKMICREYRFRNSGRNSMRKRIVLTMNKLVFDILGGADEIR